MAASLVPGDDDIMQWLLAASLAPGDDDLIQWLMVASLAHGDDALMKHSAQRGVYCKNVYI